MRARLAHRADQLLGRLPALLQHRGAEGEDLLHPAAPDLRGREHDHTYAARHRRAVPRLAHAGAVDLPGLHRVGHERRSDGDDLDLLVGSYARGGEPVAQHVVVARIAVHHAEAQRVPRGLARASFLGECSAELDRIGQPPGFGQLRRQFGREGHGIAVEPEHERRRQRLCRAPAAERGGDRQRGDQVRGVGVAVKQPVEHRRPADVALERKRQSLFLGKAVLVREDRQAGIDQRQKADRQLFGHSASPLSGPNSSWAVTTASAISAIRRLELIALRRSSA